MIRDVTTNYDTLNHSDQSALKVFPELDNDNNSLRFQYAAQFYEQEHRTVYQTYLDGFDKSWSDWNKNSYKEYTNLPPGAYTFRARAQNIYNTISEEATYKFTILPPWYATWWAFAVYFILFVALVYSLVKFQSNRLLALEKRRAQEKEYQQAKEIERAYEDLKSTQNQLVYSEKMASLGELTAGIAHEIQNPLNFVNNFSDVNRELVEELIEAIDKNDISELKAIAGDIEENEKKIVHHGKRAEEIVRSMLQHSRGTDGTKELTDINALADEYLRLAFHGFRARDKSFNADFKTEFNEDIPRVYVVPQDIGRVLLNLINNAFQAVAKVEKPLVVVKTGIKNGMLEIKVQDNGPGIGDDLKDKIFQPFFTTKPTGEGTGLGLSLSYDIVVTGHGGEIELNTIERSDQNGIGTEFLIKLRII